MSWLKGFFPGSPPPLVMSPTGLEFAEQQAKHPQVFVRLRIIAVDLQCLPEASNGFIELSLLMPGNTQIVVRLGVMGVDAQCALITANCLVQAFLLAQNIAQVALRFRISGMNH